MRQRGRPRKGWKEEAERDLQELGVRKWRELVTDREKWKDIVRQTKDRMEGHCSKGQSPLRAVEPMEEDEEEEGGGGEEERGDEEGGEEERGGKHTQTHIIVCHSRV